ncbi:COG4315 family predicted lipoprotein [Arthrobacter rhombi]|uniref:COG4315 family predicted lipoprotein n=1 Tax=Arthrobacter rhombi TaxID=71253 RepID=UPI003FD5716F
MHKKTKSETQSTTPAAPEAPSVRRRRRYGLMSAVAGAAVVLGGATAYFVGNRDMPIVDSGAAGVNVGAVDGFGDILVDGEGRTLYVFEPDEATEVTCTGGCAKKWPPLETTGTTEPVVAEEIDATAVSTIADQEGTDVLTFRQWPLYRYVSDDVGEVTGNGKDQNGGVWWALTPSGERVPAK